MSNLKKKNAIAVKEIDKFQGIDMRSPGDGEGKVKSMVNYRILPDGSLRKRGGLKFIRCIDEEIRAFWTGYENDEFAAYVVAGSHLYRLRYDENGEYIGLKVMGKLKSSSGPASIFFYRGYFYVIDGVQIYVVKGNVYTATGYAPLFGKDWPTGVVGEEYEPINLLTKSVRISYVVTDPPNIFLCTKYPVSSIEAVYVNGELMHESEYQIDNTLNTINISLLNPGDRVLAYFTFSNPYGSADGLKKTNHAVTFGGINSSRIFAWSENSNNIFCSKFVSEASLRESERVYTGAGALYFPANYDFCVGDGSKSIKGVSRHYDRLLIFTEGEAWMADSESCGIEDQPVMRINALSGAASVGGIARCENDPVSVDKGAVLRWNSNTDELDDCNAYSISEQVKGLLPEDFFENAVAIEDKFHNEILFAKKGDDEGRVYVYEEKNGNWYTYDLIGIDGFYRGKNSIGVYKGADIYIFDDSLNVDIDLNGTEKQIKASLSTYPMDFEMPHHKKRIGEVRMLADTDGEEIKVSFTTDKGFTRDIVFGGEDTEYVESYEKRVNSERFVRTSMEISTDAVEKQRIYKMDITVKN